jgi:hypothetical protein
MPLSHKQARMPRDGELTKLWTSVRPEICAMAGAAASGVVGGGAGRRDGELRRVDALAHDESGAVERVDVRAA